MSFLLFLLVTATLFIRPAEIVEDLQALPIYEWLILSCLALSIGRIAEELQPARLRERPITLCVLGMLVAVPLSHLSHFNLWGARHCTIEFSKTVIYYLLLVANVNTPVRLRDFLLWLLGCIVVVALLGILQYHEVIDIPSLAVLQEFDYDELTGERFAIPRLRSTGIFNDPNDLSMILVAGIVLSTWRLIESPSKLWAPALLSVVGVAGYCLILTKSRGGLLALGSAGLSLVLARYGLRKALLLAALTLPAIPLLVAGRQADIGSALDNKSGQSRVRLWSEGLALFRGSPVFGIGQNEYAEQVYQVAHNSFVHCFTELGIFGGSLFLAAFALPTMALFQLGHYQSLLHRDLRQTRPYVLALLTGYGVSLLSLSRAYVVPTYLILGIAAVWLRLSSAPRLLPSTCFDALMLKRMGAGSVAFLGCTYVFVRTFVRWSGS